MRKMVFRAEVLPLEPDGGGLALGGQRDGGQSLRDHIPANAVARDDRDPIVSHRFPSSCCLPPGSATHAVGAFEKTPNSLPSSTASPA